MYTIIKAFGVYSNNNHFKNMDKEKESNSDDFRSVHVLGLRCRNILIF